MALTSLQIFYIVLGVLAALGVLGIILAVRVYKRNRKVAAIVANGLTGGMFNLK